MIFLNTETDRINQLIAEGASQRIAELEFFGKEIAVWKHSKFRMDQLTGEAYYAGKQDILERKRTAIGADGSLENVKNLPNQRILDNQYAKMVDQKTNYLLGKPITVSADNTAYQDILRKRFDASFQRMLKYIGEDALNGGVGWLFVYYNETEKLCFRRFPAFQILPFWADDDHTVLDAAARLYLQEVWFGNEKKLVERVELYKKDGIYRYVLQGSTLIPDVELGEYAPYIKVQLGDSFESYAWERLPLIAFKYNKKEIPLITRVKSIQDAINIILSDFANHMQETPQNTILILKNYDGENLGEFRHNLSTYGAVKVRDDGGVETLSIEVNAENYKAILEVCKKALIENARGFDAKDDRISGNPNQMNIQSMYSDIDLDANGMETEFQAALQQVLWFLQQDCKTKGLGDFSEEEATIIFNRDIMINESEAIANCAKSIGILSNETIVEQHPWTKDAKKELERLQKERLETDTYAGAF